MQSVVKWVDGVTFLAESGSGHYVVMEGPESEGGRNIGVRPMEMLLMGVGGCASFDVVKILKKSRQKVSACQVKLSGQRAQGVPSPFTQIHMHFIVSGRQLKASQVAKAIELTTTKYCSASLMMEAAGVTLCFDYEIVDETSIDLGAR